LESQLEALPPSGTKVLARDSAVLGLRAAQETYEVRVLTGFKRALRVIKVFEGVFRDAAVLALRAAQKTYSMSECIY